MCRKCGNGAEVSVEFFGKKPTTEIEALTETSIALLKSLRDTMCLNMKAMPVDDKVTDDLAYQLRDAMFESLDKVKDDINGTFIKKLQEINRRKAGLS